MKLLNNSALYVVSYSFKKVPMGIFSHTCNGCDDGSLVISTFKNHLRILRGWNHNDIRISLRLGWKILILIKKKACSHLFSSNILGERLSYLLPGNRFDSSHLGSSEVVKRYSCNWWFSVVRAYKVIKYQWDYSYSYQVLWR